MDCRLPCLLFLWLWICVQARKYDIRELCDVQDGSVRISLEQGSYVQLDMEIDMNGPGTNCEIVVQSTHKDDGLLVYFEHFDFIGSNFASVFRRQPCGNSILRMMDGEIHYLSSCMGNSLADAPPMSTYSSLGAVRLQLLPANLTTLTNVKTTIKPTTTTPMKFSVIATASQKSVVSDDCPSGCCREPYMFKCPLLKYCIDVKLTCNNVTNCGPRVETPHDENGDLCNNYPYEISSDDNQIIAMEDVNVDTPSRSPPNSMLRPVWSHESDGDFGDIGNAGVPQAFYTRVELVCGIVSIALFCLAGIGVLVCKVKTNNPQTRSRAASSSRRDSVQSSVYVINETPLANPNPQTLSAQSQYSMTIPPTRENVDTPTVGEEQTEASSSRSNSPTSRNNVTTIVTSKPKYFAINCEYCRTFDNDDGDSNYNVYIMDTEGRLHYPQCPKSLTPSPPSYDSLFPKQIIYSHRHP